MLGANKNAHAISRAYAKKLHDKGASVALITVRLLVIQIKQ